jgi:flavin-dependent dehydrogenase
MYDLIVIGGGPAGAAAAITASRNGARVLMLERGRFPRHKVCGEFVSAESLDLLHDLLDARHAVLISEAASIPQARIFLDGRTIQTPVVPAAASIARLDLDAALWESAGQSGVETRPQTAVQSISGAGPFLIRASTGEFAVRAVINASGRWSKLIAAPKEQRSRAKWLGIKGHFAESSAPASVDLYFFEGGYCGVQPVEIRNGGAKFARINACAMVRANVASTLHQVFGLHPALQERSRKWQPLSDPVSTSPLFFRAPEPERDGVLMAGDAAGFVDPFVGDGISLALSSGSMAAQCLVPFLRGEASLADAAQFYRREYERRLAPVFRTSSRLRRMLLLPRAVRTPMLSLLEKAPAITSYLVRKTRQGEGTLIP